MTLLRLGNGGDSDDGAGLFSVIGVAFVGDQVDDLLVRCKQDASKAVQDAAREFVHVPNACGAVSRCGWFELAVGPKVVLWPSENEDDRNTDRCIHIGIPTFRAQVQSCMPYVLTPWLAPLGGFDHDAATNVAFAALWGRLAQDRECKTCGHFCF